MTYISNCSAPDLGDLQIPLTVNYLMNEVFLGRGGFEDLQVQSYFHCFVLATDKAIHSYNTGRALLIEYAASENTTGLLLRGTAELETSVTTASRCLRLAAKLGTHKNNPDIARDQRRGLHGYAAEIAGIRNAVEHMDDEVQAGGAAGVPALLAVARTGDALEIIGLKLSFTRLAGCLREIHGVAAAIAARQR